MNDHNGNAQTMSHRAKAIYLAWLVVFLISQVNTTMTREDDWPFCSYDMFSDVSSRRHWQLEVVLLDSLGNQETIEAAQVLPIEFFRANRILQKVFSEKNSEEQREFTRRILMRIRASCWGDTDEVLGCPQTRNPVAFHLQARLIDLSQDAPSRTKAMASSPVKLYVYEEIQE